MPSDEAPQTNFKLELCSDDVADAQFKASKVDQIEFCAELNLGGLTPQKREVAQLLAGSSIPIKVMIRHRCGNFEYDQDELAAMIRQASEFQAIGVKNFVFGAVKHDRLDIAAIKAFCESVFPAQVCIHKAIDESREILADLQLLRSIQNVDEVLTSGGQKTALEGAEMIRQMIELGIPKLAIIAAGNVTRENLMLCHEKIHATMYHGKKIADE